jgi:hypothetical protein
LFIGDNGSIGGKKLQQEATEASVTEDTFILPLYVINIDALNWAGT